MTATIVCVVAGETLVPAIYIYDAEKGFHLFITRDGNMTLNEQCYEIKSGEQKIELW